MLLVLRQGLSGRNTRNIQGLVRAFGRLHNRHMLPCVAAGAGEIIRALAGLLRCGGRGGEFRRGQVSIEGVLKVFQGVSLRRGNPQTDGLRPNPERFEQSSEGCGCKGFASRPFWPGALLHTD